MHGGASPEAVDPEEGAWHTQLLSASASFMTGVALPVDGGLTIKNA